MRNSFVMEKFYDFFCNYISNIFDFFKLVDINVFPLGILFGLLGFGPFLWVLGLVLGLRIV